MIGNPLDCLDRQLGQMHKGQQSYHDQRRRLEAPSLPRRMGFAPDQLLQSQASEQRQRDI